MIGAHDRSRFLQELLVAEVIARPGKGPLARRRWPRLRNATDITGTQAGSQQAGDPTDQRNPVEPG